jgi:hypothetical protein
MKSYEVLIQVMMSDEEAKDWKAEEFFDFSETEDVSDIKVRIMAVNQPHFTIAQLIDMGIIS